MSVFRLCTYHIVPLPRIGAGQTHGEFMYPNPWAKVYVKFPFVGRPPGGDGDK